MINDDRIVFLPPDLPDLVSLINDTYLREFSVVDLHGEVIGPLTFPRPYTPRTNRIELWMGAEFAGICFDSHEEARCFLSGIVCALFSLPIKETIEQYQQQMS